MTRNVLIDKARRAALGALRDRRGGAAMTFALAVVPVAFVSLVLLDYSRASNARQALQENIDAATLIAARSTAVEADAIDAIGDKALKAQMPANAGIDGLTADTKGRITGATFVPNGTTISGTVNATIAPLAAGLFLSGPIKITAKSEVVRSVNKLEIAMVLDTTGSMQGTKIKNLREAAEDFIDTMEEAAERSTETDPVKISIVPFSSTVRVAAPLDMGNYNTTTFTMTGLPTWLDGRGRAISWDKEIFTLASSSTTRVDRFKLLKQLDVSWGGCVEARKAPYDVQDTAPSTSTVDTLFTPYFAPDEADTDYKYLDFGNSSNNYLNDGPSKNTLLSALGALTGGLTNFRGLQGLVSKYSSGASITGGGGPNDGCVQERITRLSTDFDALRASVKKFQASGETNIPMGLAWGWHTLSPNLPFADGKAYGTAKTTKIIVLMTDGDNTMSYANNDNESNYHGYGYIWQNRLGTTSSSESTRTTKLNERMSALCTNMKDKDIVIYAVGVGVSTSAKALLKACATSTDAYYDVDSEAGNLNNAFSAIAGSIENLRISK